MQSTDLEVFIEGVVLLWNSFRYIRWVCWLQHTRTPTSDFFCEMSCCWRKIVDDIDFEQCSYNDVECLMLLACGLLGILSQRNTRCCFLAHVRSWDGCLWFINMEWHGLYLEMVNLLTYDWKKGWATVQPHVAVLLICRGDVPLLC